MQSSRNYRPRTREHSNINMRPSASRSSIQNTLFAPTASSLRVLLHELYLLGCSSTWASVVVPPSSLCHHTTPLLRLVGLAPPKRCRGQDHVQQIGHSFGNKPRETRTTWLGTARQARCVLGHSRQMLCMPGPQQEAMAKRLPCGDYETNPEVKVTQQRRHGANQLPMCCLSLFTPYHLEV